MKVIFCSATMGARRRVVARHGLDDEVDSRRQRPLPPKELHLVGGRTGVL